MPLCEIFEVGTFKLKVKHESVSVCLEQGNATTFNTANLFLMMAIYLSLLRAAHTLFLALGTHIAVILCNTSVSLSWCLHI